MGEISEALERARREEEQGRGERRRSRISSEISDSLRQAAVEDAIHQATPPTDWTPEPAPAEAPGPDVPRVPLEPTEPSIVTPSHEKMELSRALANRVASELERREVHTLAVVSALRMDGKSTVSCNLAIAMASLTRGRSVALVDLDLRRPTIGAKLGLKATTGIEDVLLGRASLEDVRIAVESPELDVYPALHHQAEAHELLVRPTFQRMVQELSESYGCVVFDSPPVLLVPDASLMLRQIDGCIPVARMGVTRARSIAAMIEELSGRRLLGSILNGSRTPWHARQYESYYYGPAEETGS